MTMQLRDIILYRDKPYHVGMFTDLLEPYLRPRKIQFFPPNSACWRGYYARWEVDQTDKLYLTGLIAVVRLKPYDPQAKYEDDFFGLCETIGLDDLFPGQKRVFAQWFSGAVRCPFCDADGRVKELELVFQHGALVHVEEHEGSEEMVFSLSGKDVNDKVWR